MILSKPLISKISRISSAREQSANLAFRSPRNLAVTGGAKARAADVDELLEVHDYRAIAFFDRGSDGLLELSGVGAVNASAQVGGQYTVLPFSRHIHCLHLPSPDRALLSHPAASTSRERPQERHYGYTRRDGTNEQPGPSLPRSLRVVFTLMHSLCHGHTHNDAQDGLPPRSRASR